MARISMLLVTGVLAMSSLPSRGWAQDGAAPTDAASERAASPYDWPFRARSIEARSYARIDTSLATYSAEPSPHGYALSQLFGFGIAPLDFLVVHARGGWAFSREPSGSEGVIATNLEVGATLLARLAPEVRVAGHLSVFVPSGSAQGSDAPSHERRARQEGQRTRFGIDGPLFATNELGFAAAVSVGWVRDGLVAQLELGLAPVIRVAGDGDEAALAVQGALHVAYFVLPEWSFALELTHHQWAAGRPVGGSPDSMTAIVLGTRAHAVIGSVMLRPGIAYSHALGGALQQNDQHVLLLDLLAEL